MARLDADADSLVVPAPDAGVGRRLDERSSPVLAPKGAVAGAPASASRFVAAGETAPPRVSGYTVSGIDRVVWLNRPRRILLALAGIWVLGVFDLAFTLHEALSPCFTEMNPVAAWLLTQPGYMIIAYKFTMLGVGSLILLYLRMHRVAELAAWFLLAVKLYVAGRWMLYYAALIENDIDPFVPVFWFGPTQGF